MFSLNRDKVQRMVGTSRGGSGGGGFSTGDLAGYASQLWVQENFLSIEFFSNIFKTYGPGENEGDPDVEVIPNDTESTISNIKAMFGFWTEQYISALGQSSEGGGGGGSESLADLVDVQLTNPTAGQILKYDGTHWINGSDSVGSVTSVAMSVPTGFSVSGSPITSSGTFAVSFATGYSLPLTADVAKGVTAYGWGDHSLAGYALASNVYSKTEADARFLTISFFRSLFKAYAGSTEVVPNDGAVGTIDNIKAMFGFWTEQYLSALGQGSGGSGGGGTLAGLTDVQLTSPTAGQILKYDGTHWINGSDSVGSVTSVGLSMPTGFSVVNTPVTSSGIFSVTFSTGYSLPLTGDVEKGVSAYNSLSNYLPLAGGTMSDTAQIIRKGSSSTWISGRDNALIRMTPCVANGYSPILSLKTTNGSWEIGSHEYGSYANILLFNYITDTDYTNNTNQTTIQAYLDNGGRIITSYNYDRYALPLTGGTMTGELSFNNNTDLSWKDSNGTKRSVAFLNSGNNLFIGYGTAAAGYNTYLDGNEIRLRYSSSQTTGLMLNSSGNIGIGTTSPSYKLHVVGSSDWTSVVSSSNSRVYSSHSGGYGMAIQSTSSSSGTYLLNLSSGHTTLGTGGTDRFTVYADGKVTITGNVTAPTFIGSLQGNADTATTASKLSTVSKTAWGQTYWTSGGVPTSIDGNMSNVGNISFSASGKNIGGIAYFDTTNSRLGVGTSSPSYALDVNGYAKATRLYLANGVYLEYDSTNSAVQIVGAGLYTNSYISALGVSSGSGGGGVTLNQPLSGINGAGLGVPSTSGQALVYNGSAWTYSGSTTLKANAMSVSTSLSAYTGSFGSSLDVAAQLTIAAGNLVVTNGSAGIGGSVSSTYKLYVHGTGRFTDLVVGTTSTVLSTVTCATIETLNSRGLYLKTASGLSVYANAPYSNQSDIRTKNIVSEVEGSVDDIANAPIFNFEWKNAEVPNVLLGSSAQYWKDILPHAVTTAPNGYLSMDYSAIALAAAVVTARKVVDHEKRIAALERENEELRAEIVNLKAH